MREIARRDVGAEHKRTAALGNEVRIVLFEDRADAVAANQFIQIRRAQTGAERGAKERRLRRFVAEIESRRDRGGNA